MIAAFSIGAARLPNTILLRPFDIKDVPAITAIYAHYVEHSTVTFDTEPPSENSIANKFGAMVALKHPVIIAERDGKVLGYAYASTYRDRPAYRFTCEDTLYLAPEATGLGIGSLLLEQLITDAQNFGFRQMLGVIEASATPSIGIHKKFGFEINGRYPELGFKFDCWLDIVHMQRALNSD